MSHELNRFIEQVHDIVEKVKSSSEICHQISLDVRTTNKTISEDMSKQQSETEMLATAITEMSSSIVEVSRNAKQAAKNANQAAIESEDGLSKLNQSQKDVEQMKKFVSESSNNFRELEVYAENISGITQVINSIAEQTNLLALNAAIEAARAGENGRGFTIVAGEVRNLAIKTQASLDKIQGTIQSLQTVTRNASISMKETEINIQNVSEVTKNTTDSFNKLIQMIFQISESSATIAGGVEEQSIVTESISKTVNQINTVTENTLKTAESGSTQSKKMNTEILSLARLVRSFSTNAS
jgi:methyl-accepting chemotaxis protein